MVVRSEKKTFLRSSSKLCVYHYYVQRNILYYIYIYVAGAKENSMRQHQSL